MYLQRGVDPDEMIKTLYAKTRLECRVPFLFNALNDKEAHQYSLKRYLSEWLDFQHEIVLNEHVIERKHLSERLEIITGRIIASQCIDAIIDIVKNARDRAQIKDVLKNGTIIEGTNPVYHQLVSSFKFTELQAESISEYKLYQLTKLDRNNLTKEGKEVRAQLAYVNKIIEDEDARQQLILTRLQEEYEKLPDCPRKTTIIQDAMSSAANIEAEAVPMFLAMDKYGYLRVEGKYFEGAAESNSKARVGFFDVAGNCWNLYLDRVKETKDRGTLISRLIETEAQIIGFTTAIESEDKEGLFIFENGNMRRVLMNRYMTKQRVTKINTKTGDTPMKAYFDIPEGVNIVVVDGKEIPLNRIPLQAYASIGKNFLEPKEEAYEVSFKMGEVVPEEIPLGKDVFDGVVTFTEDGALLFDWKTLNTDGHEGVFSTTYQELIKSTLLFVHDDGTAKRVKGELFAVKTRRTQIKGNKEGTKTIAIIPVPEDGFFIGTYQGGFKKCVGISGISFQGITGGGIRVFWSKTYVLESVECVEETELPVLSFASQPKMYEEAVSEPEESKESAVVTTGYTTMGTDGFSCLQCGNPIGADDPVQVCSDCGAVFCKECADAGALSDHDCDADGDMQ